ncbi:MAG: hypothetical protein P1U64_14635 [Alcanivoracaceae bacterium]|nr:hypothetical protein [Alcanivoracaceae bacterium]
MRTGAVILLVAITTALLLWQRGQEVPATRAADPMHTPELAAPSSTELSLAPAPDSTADDRPTPANDADNWGVTQPSAPGPGSLNTDAVNALRATRQGDRRAPTIGSDERNRPLASDDLRANYADYQQWQHQHRLAGYARYLSAANEKLARIDEHLVWGAQNGVSEQDLAAAREKRARLAQSRDQLLQDYPALAAADTDTLEPVSDEGIGQPQEAGEDDGTDTAGESEGQE